MSAKSDTMTVEEAYSLTRNTSSNWNMNECALAGMRLQRHLETTPSMQCIICRDHATKMYVVKFATLEHEFDGETNTLEPHQTLLKLDIVGHSMAGLDPAELPPSVRRLWRRIFRWIDIAALSGRYVRISATGKGFGAIIENVPFKETQFEGTSPHLTIWAAIQAFSDEIGFA